jgi:curli biogenesis system outer membrane secretion channel CsgG
MRSTLAILAALLVFGATQSVLIAEGKPRPPLLDASVRTLPGPKRTVAVYRFASKSDFNLRYGIADLGGGLSAMLTSALVESGQFIVVERETVSDVLSEQELTASSLVKQEGAQMPGNLLGASLIIKGAITEFNESAGGGGFGVGVAGVGVGMKSRKAVVGLVIQVIDATTGQILSTFSVRESASGKTFSVDVARNGVDTGFSKFFETSIGQAARKAINTAVQRFADETANRPWTGRVVAFDGGEVVINAGETSGIRAGDMFSVERTTSVFTDPATGRVLGQRKVRLGTVVIGAVQSELAFGRFLPQVNAAPSRGDLVVVQ